MFKATLLPEQAAIWHRGLVLVLCIVALCWAGPIAFETADQIPITLQSLFVVLVPVLVGWQAGLMAVCGYLLCGGLGMPVFAGGASGWTHFAGATGGFLLSFPIAASVVGVLAEKPSRFQSLQGGALVLLGQLIILMLGLLWWWRFSGGTAPVWSTFQGLVPGAMLKTAIGGMAIAVLSRGLHRTSSTTEND